MIFLSYINMKTGLLYIVIILIAVSAIITVILLGRTKDKPIPPLIDKCKDIHCVNGTCVDGKCICESEWEGNLCDKKIYKPPTNFTQIDNGLSGPGYCMGVGNGYPYWKAQFVGHIDDCKTLCNDDSNCPAVSFASDNNFCVTYSTDEKQDYNPSSKNWSEKTSSRFPSYSSPRYYLDDQTFEPSCTAEFIKGSCIKRFSRACHTDNSVSCWKKLIENYEDYEDEINIGPEDGLKAQVVVSNPYIKPWDLLTTKNTFFWWFLDLINNSETFITICNAYMTLGKYTTDDPTDYHSAIHMAFYKALKRGVIVRIVTPTIYGADQKACQEEVLNQSLFKPFFNKTLFYINYGKAAPNKDPTLNLGFFAFFHDKLYISDKKAYIGGQNTSASSSIDFGIGFDADSPLYGDLYLRSIYLATGGGAGDIKGTMGSPLEFKYTASNPYVDPADGTEYFIVVSPVSPPAIANTFTFGIIV